LITGASYGKSDVARFLKGAEKYSSIYFHFENFLGQQKKPLSVENIPKVLLRDPFQNPSKSPWKKISFFGTLISSHWFFWMLKKWQKVTLDTITQLHFFETRLMVIFLLSIFERNLHILTNFAHFLLWNQT